MIDTMLIVNILWFWFTHIQCLSINPTLSSETSELYDTSIVNEFESKTIICSKPECYIICDEFRGCHNTTIIINEANILTLECVEDSSCLSMNIISGSLHTLNINCKYYESCKYLHLSYLNVSQFDFTCSAYYSCSDILFDISIFNSINIICNDLNACDWAEFNIHLLNNNSNINISCISRLSTVTNDTILTNYDASCYWTLFRILSDKYIHHSMSLLCTTHNCYASTFEIMYIDIIMVECNGFYACQSIEFKASNSKLLNINCSNSYSCYGSTFMCPYYNKNVCNLYCDNKQDACRYIEIWVHDDYIPNYLHLDCPLSALNDSCSDIQFGCHIGDSIKHWTQLIFDNNLNKYKCQHHENIYCCPFYNHFTSIMPTVAALTEQPTYITTDNPAVYPTEQPIYIGTNYPTRYVNQLSTLNPTEQPIYRVSDNPTIYTTVYSTQQPIYTTDRTTTTTHLRSLSKIATTVKMSLTQIQSSEQIEDAALTISIFQNIIFISLSFLYLIFFN